MRAYFNQGSMMDGKQMDGKQRIVLRGIPYRCDARFASDEFAVIITIRYFHCNQRGPKTGKN
jgi:hypothetical protein|tara:strand:- start:574 stop:759 length:186 start_codon:yes stop_codon:yes gene_type:complete